jgi:hypothetical protein
MAAASHGVAAFLFGCLGKTALEDHPCLNAMESDTKGHSYGLRTSWGILVRFSGIGRGAGSETDCWKYIPNQPLDSDDDLVR